MIGFQCLVQLIGFQWRIFKKSLKLFFVIPGLYTFTLFRSQYRWGPLLLKLLIISYESYSISDWLRIISPRRISS